MDATPQFSKDVFFAHLLSYVCRGIIRVGVVGAVAPTVLGDNCITSKVFREIILILEIYTHQRVKICTLNLRFLRMPLVGRVQSMVPSLKRHFINMS